MIRPTTSDDKIALIALAETTIGLFQPNQLKEVGEMLIDDVSGDSDRCRR